VGGIKYNKMNVGLGEAWNQTPAWVTKCANPSYK